ncbi:DUF7024 domain-containing protein [Massilia sp.]|uniref:ArnT family glycosyltransferase n=1 Tax=Massilia sp. TaxID=1882437 RepID=UPI00391ACA91
MTPNDTRTKHLAWPLVLTVALAGIACLLFQRNTGLQPSVFADEWYYSKFARLMPLADSMLPSYLYLWLFGASNACGDGFLDCVRIGNLAFFVGGAPFIYLIARRYTGAPAAAGVALLSALAPLNSFTVYFMPESMYYFGFCVLSWVALKGGDWRPAVHALASGAVLGLMSQVKVHAIFLLPALVPFLLAASWLRGGPWFLRGVAMAAAATLCTFAVKLGLGWLFAGDAGLSIFGAFYESTRLGTDRMTLLVAALVSARGHLMTLALVYGLPLAMLAYALCTQVLRPRATGADPADADRRLLHLYTLLMLGAAAGLTVMYTAGLHVEGSREGLRLHLRYYSFVFPLLLVVAAAALPREARLPEQRERPWLRWTLVAALGAALVAALFLLQGYPTNVVDSPDIHRLNVADKYLRILVGLQSLVLLAWAMRLRAAPLLFLCLALPAAYAASNRAVHNHFENLRPPSQTDLAAKWVHDHVPAAERGQVVVTGVDLSLILRAQFHIDHPDTTTTMIDFGEVAEYQLPLNKKWMLLLGEYQVPAHIATTVRHTPWYTVLRLPEPEPKLSHVKLSDPPDPRVVTSVEGLSKLEPWGRWSNAKRVVIEFAQPLPRRAGVVLTARAYDVNAHLPFKMHLGGQTREFKVGWHQQEIGLHFDTDGTARTLVIDVPQPVSPEERGQPGDSRKLGIGIGEIVITDGTRQVQAQAGP